MTAIMRVNSEPNVKITKDGISIILACNSAKYVQYFLLLGCGLQSSWLRFGTCGFRAWVRFPSKRNTSG